ncbi:DUF5681 domain-containing protein [Thomasclavelia cocleata]|uniref:DUF5681 domain-containing protein n=1 Tax=Thomasclavelia cocleata TaxID=69824 RepID=UPI00262A18E8|nr:DUF5681 domain-containing protein [Thomasclavelia cocleata]
MDQKINEIVEKYNEAKVGYKNPPKDTRFKKGQSGNPAGRKKKLIPKSLHEAIMLELADSVTIKDNGKTIKMSKYELLGKAIVNDAIKNEKGYSRKIVAEQMYKTDVLEYKEMIVKRAIQEEPAISPERQAELKNFLYEEMDKMYRELMKQQE